MPKKQAVGYLTPDDVPEESHCRTLRIPNSTAWLSIFMGALLPLANPSSWQKYGNLSEEEAAAAAFDVIWGAYDLANQGCPLDVRQNEEMPCILEKTSDGGETWTEFADLQLCPPLVVIGADGTPYISDDGGETYHPAPVEALPRAPVEGQDSKCLAAANGAAAMAAFYAQVQAYFTDTVLLLVALGGIIALILALLGLPIALGAAITAFTELWGILSGFVADDFDSDKQHQYQCILYCHATLTGDVVEFDYDAVLADVDGLWGPISTNIWTAVHYLLIIIGSDGLQRCGATTSVADADCSDCSDCVRDCATDAVPDTSFNTGYPYGIIISAGTELQGGDGVLYHTANGVDTTPVPGAKATVYFDHEVLVSHVEWSAAGSASALIIMRVGAEESSPTDYNGDTTFSPSEPQLTDHVETEIVVSDVGIGWAQMNVTYCEP